MPTDPPPDSPIVFISYSHDSDAHKEWVRELATDLRDRYGIDVILDQWEIGPGDDVPKFMEQSVKRALRVLMVCTEPYVRKADDGKGGAGYEAMVVTGELVADLGTRKFIPLMRQPGGTQTLPTCVSTRFYVDFSNEEMLEEKLEELARSIHKSPKFEKPSLGTNPFGAAASVPDPTIYGEAVFEISSKIDTYRQSTLLANDGDFAKWRELIQRTRISSVSSLLKWRGDNQSNLPTLANDLPDYFISAVGTHAEMFAAAFGAFDSNDSRFHNQLSVIDTIRDPKGWERSGSTIYVELPDLILFTYQALMGALTISRHNFDAALKLATTPLEDRYSRKDALPLFKSSWAMGWPESMNHTCTIAWDFLMKVLKEWTWLHELFGSEEDARAAVVSYYAFMNTLDFVSATKATIGGTTKEHAITVPLCFVMVDEQTIRIAKSLFFAEPSFISELFEENSIPSEQVAEHWASWMTECGKWVSGVYKERFWGMRDERIFHSDLPQRILQKSGRKLIE